MKEIELRLIELVQFVVRNSGKNIKFFQLIEILALHKLYFHAMNFNQLINRYFTKYTNMLL